MTQLETRSRGRPRSFHNTSDATHIKSLERAMRVLKIVSEGDGLSLGEVADRSGESAATAYRALLTMQAAGIIAFDENRQLWHVGVEAFRIGSAFLRRTSVVEQSRDVMQHLMRETGETANLAILDKLEVVFISQVETHEPIRAFFRPGTRGAAHASGIGKTLLAFQDEEAISRFYDKNPLERFTAKTITSLDALFTALIVIRAQGWAVDDEERNVGMRCIAAPIFNSYGEAVAGISVSGPSVRMPPERDATLGDIVRSAAAGITQSVGGTRPA